MKKFVYLGFYHKKQDPKYNIRSVMGAFWK